MTLGRRLADTILITPQPAWLGLGVDTGCMRITIRVKPGSARPGAGGEHDGALVVRVSARAADGKATEAALAAVAGSFGVRRSAVRLVSGASSRTKIVGIDASDPRILAALLAVPGRLRPWQDAAAVRPPVMSDVITRSAATHPPQKRGVRLEVSSVLQRRQPRRPKLNWADRALLAALLAVIPTARRHGLRLLVTPDTIVRWHRDIVRRRWAARSMARDDASMPSPAAGHDASDQDSRDVSARVSHDG